MLAVFTDQQNTNWLRYLLDEFRRINKARFDITIINDRQRLSEFKNCIYFTGTPQKGFTVFDSGKIKPNGNLVPLEENIYCFQGTASDDKNYAIPFDLFWNAFIFLSRLEEFQSESAGHPIHSYLKNHPGKKKSVFQIPVVNYMFNFLEKKINLHFPELKFEAASEPVIELSHDVDYIRKTIQLRGKQTAFNAFNFARNIFRKESLHYLSKTIIFLFSNPSYWCFDYWTELEASMNKRSIFYIYSKLTRPKDPRSWLIDPSYDVSNNFKLQDQLKKMYDQGFQIGLHGSYNSAFIPGLLEEEKNNLETAIGFPIEKTRQHWLNYQEMKTPYFHNELFRYDSTLGWNDAIGYRSGTASAYHPYDHIHDKPFSFIEVPQIIMDSTIYDYAAGKGPGVQNSATAMIKNLFLVKSAHVAVSWHQRVCSSDYNWAGYYEELLKNNK